MRSTVLVLAALAAPAAAQEDHRFADWTAACRNDGYCSARTADDSNRGASLRIGRHAEGIYWEISLTTLTEIADPNGPFSLKVDAGEPVRFSGGMDVAAYGSHNDIFFTGKNALAAMDRITPGAALAIDYAAVGGSARRADFSLDGLNAALIWIDGEQNRIGAERVAEAPPVGRALVDSLPARIPAELLMQREADTDCAPLAELPTSGRITIDANIGDAMTLYILPCWSAADNDGWKAYVSPYDGLFSSLALPEFTPTEGWTATTHLLNIHYDAAAQELTAGYRGRADGRCGTSGVWRWQTYSFRLLEFRSSPDCDGTGLDRTGFPVVWPEPSPEN